MRGPGHYDELKRAGSVAEPEPQLDAPAQPDPQSAEPAPPETDWEARETVKRAELAAKVESGRLTPAEAVYQERAFDSQNLADDTAATTYQAQRQQHDKEIEDRATENTQKLVEQAQTMRELHTRFETLGQNPADLVDHRLHERFDDRHDPTRLYRDALAEQRDDSDPYGTLERTAMAEHAAFQRDQQALAERIEAADTLTARNELQLQKDSEAADYLASTSHRIADQSEIITGTKDNEDAVAFRERGEVYRQESQQLRNTYQQRTGHWPFPQAESGGEEADPLREHAARQSQTEEASSSGSRKAEDVTYSDPNIEMTDAKLERLGQLESSGALGGAETSHSPSQPRRPGGGAEM